MEELHEVYTSFIADAAALSVKKLPDRAVDEIAKLMNLTDSKQFKNATLNKDNVLNFVRKVDKIYDTIKSKKNVYINNIDGFESFTKVVMAKNDSNLTNLFGLTNYDINLFLIAESLKKLDNDNYNEFFNYFLLTYLHSIEFVYPNIRESDNENIPDATKNNFNLVMEHFDTAMSFDSEDVGENIVQVVQTVYDSIDGKLEGGVKERVDRILKNKALPSLLTDVMMCVASESDIAKMNDEIKKLRKEDVENYVDMAEKKISTLNIMEIAKSLNSLNSISSIVDLGKKADIDVQGILSALN